MALTDKLSAIGDAIRAKTGNTDLLTLDQMPAEIASIQGGGDSFIKTVSGACPITLEDCAEWNLLDYKIYGAEGGVGDQTENLFDKHYDVGYSGSPPKVTKAPGGLSTEWYAIEDIGTNFTYALNPSSAVSATVVGYVQSNDKSTISLRRGFSNASAMSVGVDNFGNFSITNTSYAYVKFYVNNANLVNDIRIYKGLDNNLTTPYGFYIPIKVNDTTHKLLLGYNLGDGDYLDFENRKVVIGGVSTMLELPDIPLADGANVIDVDTTVKPSKMSVSFVDNNGGYATGYKEAYDKMKLAIDMSDTTYRFNETVKTYPGNWYNMNLNFTDANGASYKKIATYTSSGKINIQYTPVSGSAVSVYNGANSPMWADEAYRTIHITDGAMIGDIDTFKWMLNNGVFNPTE